MNNIKICHQKSVQESLGNSVSAKLKETTSEHGRGKAMGAKVKKQSPSGSNQVVLLNGNTVHRSCNNFIEKIEWKNN